MRFQSLDRAPRIIDPNYIDQRLYVQGRDQIVNPPLNCAMRRSDKNLQAFYDHIAICEKCADSFVTNRFFTE
jgi:hypothetical protein